jgi:hypothetical protein
MSTLKRSSTCHETYAGSDGEKELINALELLFFLKGKEYTKRFPDVIIPSAKEFLGFARIVSDDIYDKSRKTIAIVKYQNGATKQSVKKILQARPFLMPNPNDGTRKELLEFLNYIHSNHAFIVSNRVIMCLSTVLYAVTLYNFMNTCLEDLDDSANTVTVEATRALGEDAFKATYSKPIFRFCTTYMPILYDFKNTIVNLSHVFLRDYSMNELAVYFHEYKFPADALTGVLATVTASGLERYYVQHPVLKKILLKPLVGVMYEAGIRI